jgi:predicted acyl esterase
MSRAMIFDRDVMIPTRTGEPLGANVYRPVDDEPHPVLLTVGPYGKDRHWADRDQQHARDLGGGPFINWETPNPETWVPKGYVVVRVDGRGTGASPGHLDLLAAENSEAYYDAVEWAAAQPWSTGRVGLLGISFYAMNQWGVAALRPPHLAAMVPWEAAADMYRDFTRAGGILNSGFLSWWWPNTVLNVQHGVDGSLSEADRAANRMESLNDECLEHPLDGPFYEQWNAALSQIETPLLSVGNWGNIGLHLRGNIEGFLNAASTDKWLRIIVGDHIHPFYEPESIELQERFLDHFLKGEDNGWEAEPRVMLAIRDADQTTWRGEEAWPLPSTEWTELHLDASALSLGEDAPEAEGAVAFTAMEETLTFSTEPYATRTEITGPVVLTLTLSSSTTDADVFVRLGRIDPDGTDVMAFGPEQNAVALTQGWLRASHRKLDPERSLPHRPFHSHDELQPLTPGEPVQVEIEIWATSIVLPAGSRLILDVAGAELPSSHFFHQDERDRPPERFAGTTTIHTGAGHGSRLLLPVIPAAGA